MVIEYRAGSFCGVEGDDAIANFLDLCNVSNRFLFFDGVDGGSFDEPTEKSGESTEESDDAGGRGFGGMLN